MILNSGWWHTFCSHPAQPTDSSSHTDGKRHDNCIKHSTGWARDSLAGRFHEHGRKESSGKPLLTERKRLALNSGPLARRLGRPNLSGRSSRQPFCPTSTNFRSFHPHVPHPVNLPTTRAMTRPQTVTSPGHGSAQRLLAASSANSWREPRGSFEVCSSHIILSPRLSASAVT